MRIHHCLVAAALAAALPAQLNGPYTVGPGGSFANMTAAISALNTMGVAGPVSFLVQANDTGPWTIGAIPGQGPSRPILFDGQGSVNISGVQPVLTLNGCDSITFRGFTGTFSATGTTVLVNAGTANCVFTGCDFQAPAVTTGSGVVFLFAGGTGCRIEDSTFGGGWEALQSAPANDSTTVQRCRIIGGGWWIMRLGGSNFTLVNNFIYGNSNYGIAAGISGLANGVNLRIRHNSVYIVHPTSGSQYCSLRWYTSAAGSEVLNNIFYDSYPTLSTGVFNVWCLSALRPITMNYNCFWSNQAGYVPFFAGTNQTMAGWQALGFDANSIQADPLYVLPNFTPPLLQIPSNSPCAVAGTATVPPVTVDLFQSMRSTPVSMGAYEEAGGFGSSYAVFGAGCAGSGGVPTNAATPTPMLGATSVIRFGNLPSINVMIIVAGVNNSFSALGPLPFHLAPFGAPGCSARVSIDASSLLVGTGGSASYALFVPNLPQLMGMQLFTQGLALDPGRNAMGAVTSDAAVARVGI